MIKSKTFHKIHFEEMVNKFLENNNLSKKDIITITSGNINMTIWYWSN
jgi:hypothetical protein